MTDDAPGSDIGFVVVPEFASKRLTCKDASTG
jgi:hypothetical protein